MDGWLVGTLDGLMTGCTAGWLAGWVVVDRWKYCCLAGKLAGSINGCMGG